MKIDSQFDEFNPKSYRISTAEVGGDIAVVEIGYNRVPRGLKQIMRRDVYIVYYITEGKGIFLDEEFDERHSYIVVPNEIEIVESDDEFPYEAYWIMFKGVGANDILEKCGFKNRSGVFEFSKNKECAKIIRNAIFDINPANELEERCIMQSVFYQVIAVHMSQIAPGLHSLSRVQRIRSFINNNYSQQIKIGQLAKENYYTRNYLYTLFKKEYGVSPYEYLLGLRIEQAKLLLKDKTRNFSVSEVASAVGFNDSLYFSRLFRRKTGVSPTEFKNDVSQY